MKELFNSLILSQLPSYLSRNLAKLQSTNELSAKVHLIEHFYSLLVRTLTITLVSQYLIQDKDKVQDAYLNELLLNKFPQLTADAWLKLLFASVRAYGNRRKDIFMKELYDLFWDISQNPNLYQLDEENALKRLGQILAEVEVERFAPKNDADWNDVAQECQGLLGELLEKFSFLQYYELTRVIEISKDNARLEIHKGLDIALLEIESPVALLQKGWFYWYHAETNRFLPLHPFLVFWDEVIAERDVAVYDRYISDRLQYLLTLLGKTVIDNKGVKDFIYLVVETLQEAKRKREHVEKLEWSQINEVCESISQHRMATVHHKYKPELYLQRSNAYRLFERFLSSEKKVFVLVGKSGVGKSNFILSLADILSANEDISAIMYDGAQLKVEPSINKIIAEDFSERLTIGNRKVEDVWREMANADGINRKQVILFVDAINENPQAKELLRQLDNLAQAPWSWLKIVFTCRPETWQVIRRGVKLAESLYYQEQDGDVIGVELQPFSYSEKLEVFSRQELGDVYEKYKTKYELKSEFADLPGQVKEILRDPLNLWLVSNIHQRQEIPKVLTISDLVEEYFESLSANGILREEDYRFLEKRLIPIMLGVSGRVVNVLTIGDIDEAGEELYETIFSEQVLSDGTRRNQSFTNLVDTEILVRNVVGHNQQITFKYERFYEYFGGKRLLEDSWKEKDKVEYFSRWAEKSGEYPFLWGVVKNALVQMLRSDEKRIEVLIRLSFTEKQNIKELMVVVLSEVGQNNLGQAEMMLMKMLSEARQKAIWTPLGITRRNDYERRVVNMKKVVVEVASGLGLVNVIVDIAGDHMEKVQSHAEKYAYYLWLKDEEKGYELIERVGERTMNRWGVPNVRKLDFFVNMVLVIFLQHFGEQRHPVRLQRILKQVLKKVFYIDIKPFGLNMYGLDYWLREKMLRASVRLVVGVTSQNPRYFPANIKELGMFFKLPKTYKPTLTRVLDYIGENKPDISIFERDVLELMNTDDVVATFFCIPAFLRQIDNFGHDLLPVIEKIYEQGMKKDRSASVSQALFILYWGYLYKKTDVIVEEKISRLEARWKEKSKGEHRYRSGQIYGCGCVSVATLAKMYTVTNFEDLPLYKYLQEAIESQDIQFVLDLIWLIEEIAVIYKQVSVALFLCKPLLTFNNPSVQERLIEVLARVKQYSPYAVDNFLLENNCPISFSSKVYAAETGEQENTLFGRAIPFMYYEVPNSFEFRQHAMSLYKEFLEAKNMHDVFVSVLRKLTIVIYGEDIFVRK